jgi:putative glutamine amidotransferase
VSGRPPRKPLIGVSIGFHEFGDYLGIGFQRPISRAGGIPVMLPRISEAMDDVLGVLDGLLLPGGRDIIPSHYGQEPHTALGNTDPGRDEFELALVRKAIDRQMPIVGICRGMQMLNVALGGTLFQDVGLMDEWVGHPSDPTLDSWRQVVASSVAEVDMPDHPRHEVSIERGSHLHRALGVETIDVSSFHHQAIDRLAPSLRVTARAEDGVIEAVECDPWVLGVQWELHEDWRVRQEFMRVFEQFISAAVEYAAKHQED